MLLNGILQDLQSSSRFLILLKSHQSSLPISCLPLLYQTGLQRTQRSTRCWSCYRLSNGIRSRCMIFLIRHHHEIIHRRAGRSGSGRRIARGGHGRPRGSGKGSRGTPGCGGRCPIWSSQNTRQAPQCQRSSPRSSGGMGRMMHPGSQWQMRGGINSSLRRMTVRSMRIFFFFFFTLHHHRLKRRLIDVIRRKRWQWMFERIGDTISR
mmetsp:Transcript_97202/g.280511  ORF Transcript_97202/g.280511 Transcript_97202/m.280511 type:complete len:208 (-) Transcript_97202:258-881(-)